PRSCASWAPRCRRCAWAEARAATRPLRSDRIRRVDLSQPPAPVTEMEQLFERLRSGLGAEWVALEPDDAALGAGDDPRLLRSSVPLADGRRGVRMAQRATDAPAFSDAERELCVHLAALTETVLRVAGEASQRS